MIKVCQEKESSGLNFHWLINKEYRPQFKANFYPEINRRPSAEEMQDVKNYASGSGILYKPVS